MQRCRFGILTLEPQQPERGIGKKERALQQNMQIIEQPPGGFILAEGRHDIHIGEGRDLGVVQLALEDRLMQRVGQIGEPRLIRELEHREMQPVAVLDQDLRDPVPVPVELDPERGAASLF